MLLESSGANAEGGAFTVVFSDNLYLYSQHVHGDSVKRRFHTSSKTSFDGAEPRYGPPPNFPKKLPSMTIPSDLPRLSPSGSPIPSQSHPPTRVKHAPPSGNKRRVDNVRDAEQALPRSPVEESNRQKMLAQLEEARRQEMARQEIARQEEYARQKLAKEQELARKEEARKAARLRKFQHAWHILNNLEHHDKETILAELLRARTTARQEYLRQWTENHVRELIAPLMRRLNKVANRLSAVDRDLAQLLAGMQEFRHNLFQRAQSTARQFEFIKNAGSVDPILRETGYKMSDIATVLLPVSTLRAIALDLKEHGLWRESVAIQTDGTIPDFFKGTKTSRARHAMIGILWVRHDLIESAAVISQELHLLRRIRTSYLLNSGVPEVFEFNSRHTRFYCLSVEMVNNSSRITAHYHHLRLMISQSSPFAGRTKSVHHPRHQFLPIKAQVASYDAHQIFKTNFPSPMASGMKTNLALQEAQLVNFRPVTIFISRMSTIAELVDDVRGSSHLGLSSSASQALATLADELFAARRELYNLLDLAMLWRGTADMYLGIIHRPRQKSALMLFVDPPANGSALPRPKGMCPTMPTEYSVPWQENAHFYPHPDSSIPIHFVTAPEIAPIILQRFSKCEVLGIDTVTTPGSKGIHPGSSPVEYLIIASDHEVAIFALGLMNPATILHSRCFRHTLGNPAILKVGVNVGFQHYILQRHFGIELLEYHAINIGYERIHRRANLDDPDFAILSSMVAQSFGTALPHLDLTRAIREVGTKDPYAFFTHLASRAYAALEMYRLACGELARSDQTALVHRPRRPAAFGPVELHMLQKEKNSRDRMLMARSPPLRNSSASYLTDLAHAMARKTFESSTWFHDLKRMPRRKRPALIEDALSCLQAYFLFTSFGQDLRMLNAVGIRHPASTILRIAEKAQLPLHHEDRIILDMFARRESAGPFPGTILSRHSEPPSETKYMVTPDRKPGKVAHLVPRSLDGRVRTRPADIRKVGGRAARKTLSSRRLRGVTSSAEGESLLRGGHSAPKAPTTVKYNPGYDKVGMFYRSLNSTKATSQKQPIVEANTTPSGFADAANQREVRASSTIPKAESKDRLQTRRGSSRLGTSAIRRIKPAQNDRRGRGWWTG